MKLTPNKGTLGVRIEDIALVRPIDEAEPACPARRWWPTSVADLVGMVREDIKAVKAGKRVFIDVRITPDYLDFPH